ncbi:MAG: hypothetical protein P1P88_25590, partial [Bacteroidales bacterium]|nr:hypothetical protein [Bacteroidales bacterium]
TADGTYYVCGSFSGTIDLGSYSATSNGKRDIFLAKIDNSNTAQWLKNYGGLGDDNAYSLLFHNNNLYLSGSFKKEINLGNGNLLTSEKFTDVFLARLDAEGLVLKASPLKSESAAQKAILQKNTAGEIFIAGTYTKAININGTILNSNGKSDIYYAKYNAQDNLEAPISFGGPAEEQLNDFQISASDDFYFAGSFEESFTSGSNILTANGKSDAFFIRIDASGQTTLAQSFGGPYNDKLKCIALDARDNIYLAGEFEHQILIGTTDYTAQRKHDVFITRLGADGTLNWDTIVGGNSYNTVATLNIAANEKFYLSGSFRGEVDTIKSTRNSKDAFIARYQTNGHREWILQAGQNKEDNLNIEIKPSGELFVSGYFSENFKFQGFEIKNKNYKDLLFGKLIDCGTIPGVNLGEDTTACSSVELIVENNYSTYDWSTGQVNNSIVVSETDTIWLKVTDKYGCESRDTIEITISNEQPLNLLQDTTICEGSILVLDAGPGFESYKWNGQDGESQFEVTEAGTYLLEATNAEGCISTDNIEVGLIPSPLVDLGPDLTLPADTFIYLTAEPAYTQYEWPGNNHCQILCIATQNIHGSAEVWLQVTAENGCVARDSIQISIETTPPPMAANP